MKSCTTDEIKSALGAKIKKIRLEKKLSQADLCYAAEIDISTLSRLEGGKLNVTIDTLCFISKVLKVEIKDFF